MKNGNESRDVLGDSRKRYRGPWVEIGKYWPCKEPIRLQDSLPSPLRKKKKKKKLLLTAYKTKCMVNGAIATAERKKSQAWVELGKDRRSPDPTQASSVLHSIAAIISTMSLRFTKWTPGKD